MYKLTGKGANRTVLNSVPKVCWDGELCIFHCYILPERFMLWTRKPRLSENLSENDGWQDW